MRYADAKSNESQCECGEMCDGYRSITIHETTTGNISEGLDKVAIENIFDSD